MFHAKGPNNDPATRISVGGSALPTLPKFSNAQNHEALILGRSNKAGNTFI